MLKKKKKELEVVEATDKPISEEKESDVKEEKEKNNPFSYSGFVVKIFSAAVLLALGLWMLFDRSTAEKLIITVSGVFIIILCLSRTIYLLRTKDLEKKYKISVCIEITLDLIAGIFLIIAGIYYQKNNDSTKGFVKFIKKNYRFFVGLVIYLRGVIHFYETGFLKFKTTVINFVINIIFITIGTICFAYKFSVKDLSLVIAIFVLLSCVYLTQDSVRHYIRFKNGGDNNKKKEKKNDVKKSDEIPAAILDKEESNQQIVN